MDGQHVAHKPNAAPSSTQGRQQVLNNEQASGKRKG
jgi:hypothetical protein